MAMNTLNEMKLDGKKVLVRADFNVPLDKQGIIMENERIVATLPTIRFLLQRGCKVILMSHLGRPDGRVVETMRLTAVATELSRLLGIPVNKTDDCIGESVKKAAATLKSGEVLLLENLRFHPEEEKNNELFAKELAGLADTYVNDAFGASHRAHASVAAITAFLPSCAGLLLEREITVLRKLLENPPRPFVAILGGAKVSDKIALIENLLKKVDRLLIGGAMAFTFLKAQGHQTGKSLLEEPFVEKARKILKGGKIGLPTDIIIAEKFDAQATSRIVAADTMPAEWIGLDIGPASVAAFAKECKTAKTVLWNGPMGVFEFDRFAQGTIELAKNIAGSSALTIIGGGETLTAAKKAGIYQKVSHASTGGGAMLEFLEGKTLPAIAALETHTNRQ